MQTIFKANPNHWHHRSYRSEDEGYYDGGGSDAYGALSSYGGEECCPLVVDSTALFTLLFAIAGAAFFLSRVAMISLTGRRRRRRKRRRRRSAILQLRGTLDILSGILGPHA